MTKVCSKCKIEKPLAEFYASRTRANGKQHRCKECSKYFTQQATKEWRANNPQSNKASNLRAKAKSKYGLPLEDIWQMLFRQNGKCLICKRIIDFDSPDKCDKPHVDHNHETGKVRGLLCLTCNTGLGMFGDSPDLLEAALTYIRYFARQSDRLSELAPIDKLDDAIVGSHGNDNHERLTEMASPVRLDE